MTITPSKKLNKIQQIKGVNIILQTIRFILIFSNEYDNFLNKLEEKYSFVTSKFLKKDIYKPTILFIV